MLAALKSSAIFTAIELSVSWVIQLISVMAMSGASISTGIAIASSFVIGRIVMLQLLIQLLVLIGLFLSTKLYYLLFSAIVPLIAYFTIRYSMLTRPESLAREFMILPNEEYIGTGLVLLCSGALACATILWIKGSTNN